MGAHGRVKPGDIGGISVPPAAQPRRPSLPVDNSHILERSVSPPRSIVRIRLGT
jgi:hypothetical protein